MRGGPTRGIAVAALWLCATVALGCHFDGSGPGMSFGDGPPGDLPPGSEGSVDQPQQDGDRDGPVARDGGPDGAPDGPQPDAATPLPPPYDTFGVSRWGVRLRLLGWAVRGIWGSSDADVWVVDSDGRVAHGDGTAWRRVATPSVGGGLNDVWGSGASDVWCVGAAGVMLHFDGTQLLKLQQTSSELKAIHGSGPDDVWAVGVGGTALRRAGATAWSLVDPDGVTATLQDVWVGGPTDVWFARGSSRLIHFDGAQWRYPEPSSGHQMRAVAGVGQEIWAGGQGGAIYAYAGGSWSNRAAPGVTEQIEFLREIDGAVYAGTEARLMRRTASGWTTLLNTGRRFFGAWRSPKGVTFAVSAGNRLYRQEPGQSSWTTLLPDVNALRAVGGGGGRLWAGGQALLRDDGRGWHTVSRGAGDPQIHALWVDAGGDAWLAGERLGEGWVARAGATAAEAQTLTLQPDSRFFRAIWGLSATVIWAAGQNGRVARYDGSGWIEEETPLDWRDIFGLWADAPDNAWGAAAEGKVVRRQGTSWVYPAAATGFSGFLRAVTGCGPDDIWFVGDGGTVLRYDGTAFESKGPGGAPNFVGVALDGPLLHALDGRPDKGDVWTYDGGWDSTPTGPDATFFGMWGGGPSDVWIVGAGGRVRHYRD